MVVARKAVSLFTGAGIGDVGFRAAGIDFVVMNELEATRAGLAAVNFPNATVLVGDIWERSQEIVSAARAAAPEGIFLVTCTAPCQGMSKNGQGTLLRNARAGKRPNLDPRNRLILPALEVIKELRPEWVVFENVSEMANTVIEDREGQLRPILEVIESTLGQDWSGRAYDLEFADYGVPQRRRRLITVYTRTAEGKAYLEAGGEFAPTPTHSQRPAAHQMPWISVATAIADFPPLDAASSMTADDSSVPFHRVSLLDGRKYSWVEATPAGASAFDNQCNVCGFDGNETHGASRNSAGINQSKKTTPMFCVACGSLLPRPHVVDPNGQVRIMSGYTSAYKRMVGRLPAPALTRNLLYACSDQKLHPTQNRTLSLAEAFRVHTLSDYEYRWESKSAKRVRDTLIALVLGESVPPHLTELLGRHIVGIAEGAATLMAAPLGGPAPVAPTRRKQEVHQGASRPRRPMGQIAVWSDALP